MHLSDLQTNKRIVITNAIQEVYNFRTGNDRIRTVFDELIIYWA